MERKCLNVEQGSDANGDTMTSADLRGNVRNVIQDGWNIPGRCKYLELRCGVDLSEINAGGSSHVDRWHGLTT